VEYVPYMEKMKNVYKILDRVIQGKRPLGRPKCRWKYDIKMNVREG
jgi:hypothetical protein